MYLTAKSEPGQDSTTNENTNDQNDNNAGDDDKTLEANDNDQQTKTANYKDTVININPSPETTDFILQSQFANTDDKRRSPTATADKGFMCVAGKVSVECTLDREVYYHGEELPIKVAISNNSSKSVKSIRVQIGNFQKGDTFLPLWSNTKKHIEQLAILRSLIGWA